MGGRGEGHEGGKVYEGGRGSQGNGGGRKEDEEVKVTEEDERRTKTVHGEKFVWCHNTILFSNQLLAVVAILNANLAKIVHWYTRGVQKIR